MLAIEQYIGMLARAYVNARLCVAQLSDVSARQVDRKEANFVNAKCALEAYANKQVSMPETVIPFVT